MKHLYLILAFAFSFMYGVNAQKNATVSEIPFIISQTGQIILEARINGDKRPALFYLESNGKNCFRSDQLNILSNYQLNIDKTSTIVNELKIGDFYYKNYKFKIRSSLENRGEISFPKPILGTINASLFQNQVIQLDFKTNTFRIANNIEDFTIGDSAIHLEFRNSFVNPGVSFEIESRLYGMKDIALDTRSPLGIHFFYSDLTTHQRNRYKKSLTNLSYKLDGETPLTFGFMPSPELYFEDIFSIQNQGVWFSDYVPNSIGNGFIKHFIVTINFINNTIYFDPISEEGKNIFKSL